MKEPLSLQRRTALTQLYKSGKYTTQDLAQFFDITPRQVQRLMKAVGVVRTQAEANKLMAPLKKYKKIPQHLRVKRTQISNKLRYEMIREHPFCKHCGSRPEDGVRLEIDHVDNDVTNNAMDNLQVLCTRCNTGKFHSHRY